MFFDVHPENCFGVGGISIVHGHKGSSLGLYLLILLKLLEGECFLYC